jgi:hypothetical protein
MHRRIVVTLLLAWILVPITGDGTQKNPYRPSLPPAIILVPGLKWTAQMPFENGKPKFSDAWVYIPDSIRLPKGITQASPETAKANILARDPKASTANMERLK